TNGDWTQTSAVSLPRAVAGARAGVGSAVLLEDDRAFVGAPGAAAVFVLARDATDAWMPVDELRPFQSPRNTQFGHALAIAADELWVGAPAVNGSNGRVYRFT